MSTLDADLRYDAQLLAPNRWRLSDDGDAILFRFRFAYGPEHFYAVPLHAARIRRWDEATWRTQAMLIPGEPGRVAFTLHDAPERVNERLAFALANCPTERPPPPPTDSGSSAGTAGKS